MPNPPPEPSSDVCAADALLQAGAATVEQRTEAGSTMDVAREIALGRDRPLPAIVLADRQTSGRGRRGAGWWQSPGGLAVSLVVEARSLGAAAPQPIWSLACGVALAETIRALDPAVPAVVRWPNDVEVAGRKLAGILVETAGADRVIFGIGVNSTGTVADAPAALRHRVVTIPDVSGRPLGRQQLLVAFLPRFLALLCAHAAEPLVLADRYRPLCALAGRDVVVYSGSQRVVGTCRGIDPAGGLLVETADGVETILSGSLTPPEDVWPGDP